jgi:hypothetical protein
LKEKPVPIVAVDQGVDLKTLKRLRKEGRITLVQVHGREQELPAVPTQGSGPFRLGFSRLGGLDRIAGANVRDVERILGKGKHEDVAHVYAAWLNGCCYFVTNDRTDFIDGRRREALQAVLPGLLVRTLGELIRDLEPEHR